MPKPRVLFMGTPEFAVPSLVKLLRSEEYEMTGIVTQPDRPAGRGRKLAQPPIKLVAEKHGIQVFQPPSLKQVPVGSQAIGTKDGLFGGALDLLIVVAYGLMIPNPVLEHPRLGAVNVHPSLLPRFRGAAPIQQTIFAGDKRSGVSIMKLDHGLDTGPVYAQREIEIAENETYGSLHDRLADLGADMLIEYLPRILRGDLLPTAQPEEGVSYASKWEIQDLTIQWTEEAATTMRRIHASSPHPGARAKLDGVLVKIYEAHLVRNKHYPVARPGEIVEVNRAELIVAGGGNQYLAIDEMQFPGKKSLPIRELLKGHSFEVGSCFES